MRDSTSSAFPENQAETRVRHRLTSCPWLAPLSPAQCRCDCGRGLQTVPVGLCVCSFSHTLPRTSPAFGLDKRQVLLVDPRGSRALSSTGVPCDRQRKGLLQSQARPLAHRSCRPWGARVRDQSVSTGEGTVKSRLPSSWDLSGSLGLGDSG